MSNHYRQPKTRRDMLTQCGVGFGALAFAALFGEQAQAANVTSGKIPGPLAAKLPMFAPKAKRVIFLFMHGGPSQVDTFDPKPLLTRDSGKPFPGEKPRVQFAQTGNLLRSPWEFKKYGQSGIEVSDLFPHIAQHVDDMCVIRSMYGSNPAHGGALLALHTGSGYVHSPQHGIVDHVWPGNRKPEPARLHHHLPHPRTRRRAKLVQRVFARRVPGDAHRQRQHSRPKAAAINYIKNGEVATDLQRMQLDMLKGMNEDQLKHYRQRSRNWKAVSSRLNWRSACRPKRPP